MKKNTINTINTKKSEISKDQIDSVIDLYKNGHFKDAIEKIKHLNDNYPNVPLLFNLVGACYKSLGDLKSAAQMFKKAVDIKKDYFEAHKNLGITLKDLGSLDSAINSFKLALSLEPNHIGLQYNLATTYKELGLLDDAVNSYKEAIAINPGFAEAHNNLGNVLVDLEQLDDAVNNFNRAIDINPRFVEAYYNLGVAFRNLRKLDEAVLVYKNALNIDPNYVKAHNNLGRIFTLLGEQLLAIECYEKAIAINHNYYKAHKNLGFSLLALGKVDKAVEFFLQSIAINPNYAEAHMNLGYAFKRLKQLAKAMECFERAYDINPDLDFILGDILNNKMHLCDWDDLPNLLYKIRLKIVNNEKVVGPFSLLGLIDEPALQKKAVETFVNHFYPKNHTLPPIKNYSNHSKIRVGYFSADFKIHPVATLTAELYEMHDRNQFEIHAFSFGPDTGDEMNRRIKSGVDYFHDVKSRSHKEIALLARSLEIDIAVDLGGFTARSRTDVFALSAGTIQLSYIGYLGTMGASYYDYLIADPIMIPEKNKKYFTEKILYLPNFQVNDSKEQPPKITLNRKELGIPEKRFIFCCFNNTYKFTPSTFDSWGRILKQVDDSVLVIYANNEVSKTNLTKEITLRGVDPSRLIFGDRLARPEYLARYRVADLFLDTLPYNAGTTASDALRMGLPVLTLKGDSYPSRMAASIINAVNMPELITNTPDEYESLAIELAKNPQKFKMIKDKLAHNLSSAALYDTSQFTRNLESGYRAIYERSQRGLKPDHIHV